MLAGGCEGLSPTAMIRLKVVSPAARGSQLVALVSVGSFTLATSGPGTIVVPEF